MKKILSTPFIPLFRGRGINPNYSLVKGRYSALKSKILVQRRGVKEKRILIR
ncbi:MAG: hypothetical protein Q7J16_10470 [Candidatus Cloacimonadales bacterium]|nr:hypothetical protein [Candidatus Cloacimonadales bacterium]